MAESAMIKVRMVLAAGMQQRLRMANNSKFVLRWEIDNATAVHAAGKAESKVFNKRGFRWTVMAEKNGIYANFTLKCAVNHNRPWKCVANVIMRMSYHEIEKNFIFNEDNDSCLLPRHFGWGIFISNQHKFVKNDKITFTVQIHIINSESGELSRENAEKFSVANNRSDVILKIGNEKLHVSKELLSIHSPVFETMFFSDFVEKGKEEIELNDIDYEEFLDLLNVIYLLKVGVTDFSVHHILKLADRFQMERLMDMSEKHLIQSGMNVIKKLIIAVKYRLVELRDHCLNSFSSVRELDEKLKLNPEVANFSDELKLAIFNRYSELKTR